MEQVGKRSKKGFTVAELLIVVGIIAVLVGIAIPIYRHKAEKAREAYDIYTMRQAASAAIDLYYMGIHDEPTATNAGLCWNSTGGADQVNAYGIYNPATGGFIQKSSRTYSGNPYGKGTGVNGGTKYTMGNINGAYDANLDYTNAVVLVSIFPRGNNRHVDVYWKNVKDGKGGNKGSYVGGQGANTNDPHLSIRIPLG